MTGEELNRNKFQRSLLKQDLSVRQQPQRYRKAVSLLNKLLNIYSSHSPTGVDVGLYNVDPQKLIDLNLVPNIAKDKQSIAQKDPHSTVNVSFNVDRTGRRKVCIEYDSVYSSYLEFRERINKSQQKKGRREDQLLRNLPNESILNAVPIYGRIREEWMLTGTRFIEQSKLLVGWWGGEGSQISDETAGFIPVQLRISKVPSSRAVNRLLYESFSPVITLP